MIEMHSCTTGYIIYKTECLLPAIAKYNNISLNKINTILPQNRSEMN